MDLTIDQINYYFHYDRENGKLYWKNHWDKSVRTRFLHKEAGTVRLGYRRIILGLKVYTVHRLIWFIENRSLPTMIDHINGDSLDNRIQNLRTSASRKNQQNQRRHREGKLVGASFHKASQTWRAVVKIEGKQIYLGLFNTELEAHQRYVQELKARGLV